MQLQKLIPKLMLNKYIQQEKPTLCCGFPLL
jgi:hypothetical protein